MPELRWTLLILGALFIGGLALWEWRRQRHARGPDNAPGSFTGAGTGMGAGIGGRDGERISPTFDGGGSGERISPTFDGARDITFADGSGTLTPSRGTYREPTLTFPEVSVEMPVDSRDRFADPPVVELDDDSLDRLKVEAGEAVDEFSEPREPGEAVDDFSDDDLDAPSPAQPMVPKLSAAAVAPTLGAAAGFAAERGSPPRRGELRVEREPVESSAGRVSSSGASTPSHEPSADKTSGLREGSGAGGPVDPHDEPTTRFDVSSSDSEFDSAGVGSVRVVAAPVNADSFDVIEPGPAEPIVEWPEEDTRKIVALRLVSGSGERFAGRAVRLALAAEGFVLGKFDIFHKPGPDARAVLSAASLTKPGTFSLGTMDAQRFGGLSLFAVLPGPLTPLATFDELLTTARALNDRLRGALQDERGEPLTPVRSANIRESLTASATAAAPVVGAAAAPPVVGSPDGTSPA